MTLALFAHACLTVIRAQALATSALGGVREARKKEDLLIPLTVPEVRRLSVRVIWPHMLLAERALAWSTWQRHHEAVAQACHYR